MLLEHRFLEWVNREIDEHALERLRMMFGGILWLANNPLGLTGIIIVLLLAVVFLHAYLTSSDADRDDDSPPGGEPPSYARWVLIGAVVIAGTWIMSSYVAGQPLWSRIVFGLLFWGVLGVSLNEVFMRVGDAQTIVPSTPPNIGGPPLANSPDHVTGMSIIGNGQGGPAAEVSVTGTQNQRSPPVGLDVNAVAGPGQSATGLSVTQTGPGTGLKVTVGGDGPSTGARVTVGTKPQD